jgi:hypothetical protein
MEVNDYGCLPKLNVLHSHNAPLNCCAELDKDCHVLLPPIRRLSGTRELTTEHVGVYHNDNQVQAFSNFLIATQPECPEHCCEAVILICDPHRREDVISALRYGYRYSWLTSSKQAETPIRDKSRLVLIDQAHALSQEELIEEMSINTHDSVVDLCRLKRQDMIPILDKIAETCEWQDNNAKHRTHHILLSQAHLEYSIDENYNALLERLKGFYVVDGERMTQLSRQIVKAFSSKNHLT